jgi:hypothetical protein
VLKGGIKGWVNKFGGANMDWYDPKVWVDAPKCEYRR